MDGYFAAGLDIQTDPVSLVGVDYIQADNASVDHFAVEKGLLPPCSQRGQLFPGQQPDAIPAQGVVSESDQPTTEAIAFGLAIVVDQAMFGKGKQEPECRGNG